MGKRYRMAVLILMIALAVSGCMKAKEGMGVAGTTEEEQGTEDKLPQDDNTEDKDMEDHTKPEDGIPDGKKTMADLLRTALLPVGSTMYIWGGGWNAEDTGAGPGATTIGLYPDWAEFAALQTEDYNMNNHRYEILNGLDCSGYIGWLVYNMMETESGKPGYVYKSTETAKKYSELGWGEYIKTPEEFLAGDIVSITGHVWLALGTCKDGSVVLLHSSPPGVSICGTTLADGSESEAIRLAKKYMEKYAPEWQEKHPNRAVSHSYLNAVGLFRWSEDVLPLAEEYRNMDVERVLRLLAPLKE